MGGDVCSIPLPVELWDKLSEIKRGLDECYSMISSAEMDIVSAKHEIAMGIR